MSVVMRTCNAGFFARLLAALVMGGAMVGAIGGCGGSVTGKWVLDKDKTLKSTEAAVKEAIAKEAKNDPQPEAVRKAAEEFGVSMMKAMIEQTSMTLEIRSDKTFKMTSSGPGSADMEGTWEKTKDGYKMTPKGFGAVMTIVREGSRLSFRPPDPDAPKFYMKRG